MQAESSTIRDVRGSSLDSTLSVIQPISRLKGRCRLVAE